MGSFLTLSNLFKQFQSFNQITPAAYLKSAMLNSYQKSTLVYINNKFMNAKPFINIKHKIMFIKNML